MQNNRPHAIFPFQEEIILEDERVLLRPLQEEDANELYPYVISEPELFTYALHPMRSRSDLDSYIEQALIQRERGLEYSSLVGHRLHMDWKAVSANRS
jgi:RimJ/RimL family protein N-acetyltransferase